MRLAPYRPGDFPGLARSVAGGGPAPLRHRSFVDHYYASSPACRLHLAFSDGGDVVGGLGVERMRFDWRGRERTLGFGSNFYARLHGVGGYLYLQWLRSCDIGLAFGGSGDSHRIFRERKWTYFAGVRTYCLNPPYEPRAGEPPWRRVAKWVLRRARRAPLGRYAARLPGEPAGVSVREEAAYEADLIPRGSPFTLRFAPSLEELRWRYGLALPFVRYRLYRVLARGVSAGYVILNESPERILVAHCDGNDAAVLARGVLLSLLEAGRQDREPRTVLLAASHPEMQRLYEGFGFEAIVPERPLAMLAGRKGLELPSDPSGWLVSYDWGDNGLRPPFADEA